MIIGKEPLNSNKNLKNKWLREEKEENKKNIFTNDLSAYKYASPTNNDAMYDKSLAMLNERLEKGMITLEEFNKKCASLGKKRANNIKNDKLL